MKRKNILALLLTLTVAFAGMFTFTGCSIFEQSSTPTSESGGESVSTSESGSDETSESTSDDGEVSEGSGETSEEDSANSSSGNKPQGGLINGGNYSAN